MKDLMSYLDNHEVDERKLYFMYLNNYSQFKEWAKQHDINLQLPYIDPETNICENSSLYFWVDNMEEY